MELSKFDALRRLTLNMYCTVLVWSGRALPTVLDIALNLYQFLRSETVSDYGAKVSVTVSKDPTNQEARTVTPMTEISGTKIHVGLYGGNPVLEV